MSATIAEPSRAGGHACNCGCTDCRGECCELECLVQPRFFCGQLLTDQDLSALLDWVKGKTALSRYRHGWGVVCGLDVRCGAKGGGAASVTVLPGYAVDCCGNDVVVCEEASIDLSKYCDPEYDPCADWPRPDPPPADDAVIDLGGWAVPSSQLQAVDLFVRYSESASDARTALARGGCAPAEVCEYTRTREGYELYARKAESRCWNRGEVVAPEWESDYRRGLATLYRTLGSINSEQGDVKGAAAKLGRWLADNPLESFCFVREWMCDIEHPREGAPAPPQDWFARAAFWVVQDWRNRRLRCDCYGCGPESGVPLAKVLLWRQPNPAGKPRCKVVQIDSYPPFRRPLRQECPPAPAGHESLAPFVWQHLADATAALRKLNVGAVQARPLNYGNLDELYALLRGELLYTDGRDLLVANYVADSCGQSRVVFFSRGSRLVRDDTSKRPQPSEQALALTRVPAVGPAAAARLKEHGIGDLRALASADAAKVKDALSTMPRIRRPDETISQTYIDSARRLLADMDAGYE